MLIISEVTLETHDSTLGITLHVSDFSFKGDQLSHRLDRRVTAAQRMKPHRGSDSRFNMTVLSFSVSTTNDAAHDDEDVVDEDDGGVFQVSGVCQQCVEV